MIVRRRVLEEVGLFDEDFFLYFEEVDLCRRIRAAGFEIYFVPEASVSHLSGATTGMGVRSRRLPRYWYQSRAHYYRKAAGPFGARLYDVVAVAATCLRRLRELVGRKPPRSPGFLRDFIRYGWRDEPIHRSAASGAAPPEGENRHESSRDAVG
jgi:GT2 family glycosyltransferase